MTTSETGLLRGTKNLLPANVLMCLYGTLIETRLRYGNVVRGNCGETLLTKFQKIKKGAARIITDSDSDAPAEPLLRELGISSVRELIRYYASVMMPKIKYG